MRVKTTACQKDFVQKDQCLICLENFRKFELQSFLEKHRLHLGCRECIKQYLDYLVYSTEVVRCPYCRLPIDNILHI